MNATRATIASIADMQFRFNKGADGFELTIIGNDPSGVGAPPAPIQAPARPGISSLTAIWLAGFIAAALTLLIGVARLVRIAARAAALAGRAVDPHDVGRLGRLRPEPRGRRPADRRAGPARHLGLLPPARAAAVACARLVRRPRPRRPLPRARAHPAARLAGADCAPKCCAPSSGSTR